MRPQKKYSPRSSKPQSIGEALNSFVNAHKMGDKFDETKLLAFWETIVGSTISSRTTFLKLKNKQLTVKVDSAPLRNELLMSKQKLVDSVNKFMEKEVVDAVIIL